MKFIHLPAVAVLLTCLTCLGCDGDWRAETYPAEGNITINGEPPVGAVIELHATGEAVDVRNSRPWAIVQEDGSYALSTYETNDGAPAGEYAVTLRWPPDVSQPSLADRLNNAYASPDRSQWTMKISEGDNRLPPIEITRAKVLSKEQTEGGGGAPLGPGMGG